MRILLIEPDRPLARTYVRTLEKGGHMVAVAGTAQAAIHVADSAKPDLVLLEMQLVSHSGVEFLYEFRSYDDWQDVPVVVLSHVPPAEFALSRELLSTQLGVVAYHYKPRTSLQSLLRIVIAIQNQTLPTPVIPALNQVQDKLRLGSSI